jgi:hypothetical protein
MPFSNFFSKITVLGNTFLSRLVLLGQDTTGQGVVVGQVSSSSVSRSSPNLLLGKVVEHIYSVGMHQRSHLPSLVSYRAMIILRTDKAGVFVMSALVRLP